MIYKQIAILGKSYKNEGYCIGGIDMETGRWVRPVSSDAVHHGAVPRNRAFYADGTPIQLFDVVRIPIVQASPSLAQNENYLYDESFFWEKIGTTTLQQIVSFRNYDNPPFMFVNTERSLEENQLDGTSLLLLPVDYCKIVIKTFDDGARKVRFTCRYNRNFYNFISVGDPDVLEEYRNFEDGTYPIDGTHAAVFSLTDKFEYTGKYYKMLAQLF